MEGGDERQRPRSNRNAWGCNGCNGCNAVPAGAMWRKAFIAMFLPDITSACGATRGRCAGGVPTTRAMPTRDAIMARVECIALKLADYCTARTALNRRMAQRAIMARIVAKNAVSSATTGTVASQCVLCGSGRAHGTI